MNGWCSQYLAIKQFVTFAVTEERNMLWKSTPDALANDAINIE